MSTCTFCGRLPAGIGGSTGKHRPGCPGRLTQPTGEPTAMNDIPSSPPATTQQWRLLHSYIVDSILGQDGEDERMGLVIVFGGLTCRNIVDAINRGERARVRSLLDDDGVLVYRVEVKIDDGTWQGLCRPPAHALGFDVDDALAAEQWLWRVNAQREGLPPDPDDEVA